MSNRYERYQYIYGNTVKEVEEPVRETEESAAKQQAAAPEPRRRQPEHETKTKSRPHVVRNPDVSVKFSRTFTCIVAALVVLMLSFLYGKNELIHQQNALNKSRAELTVLMEENYAKKTELENSVNEEEVKKYAEDRLGMVEPGEQDIIYYDGASSDYVRQYEDIPGVE